MRKRRTGETHDETASSGAHPPGAYLLLAPSAPDGEAFVEALAEGEVERLVLFGDDVKASRLLETVGTPTLTGTPRLVLVRHAEAMPAGEARALLEALARYPLREEWLVLWDASPEGRLAQGLASGNRGAITVVDRRRDGDGSSAAAARVVEHLGLAPATAAWLRGVLRHHPDRAPQELAKLELLAGEPLDEATVRLVVSQDLLESAEEAAAVPGGAPDSRRFEVGEAVLGGDVTRALTLSLALQRQGVPPAWIWRDISRQVMEAWEMAEALEARWGPPGAWPPGAWRELAPRFAGRPPVALRRWAEGARRWGTEGLWRLLQWTAEADYDAKRGGMTPHEALIRLFARMGAWLDARR
ncbi:DNA polymerase III subunit delta [Geochorda subterranea]|uniref:DNA polymerase III delta subunit n=1 Tax=Geochorda subterranea TaxID=3109564 RepID=A0ABZ1BLZ9_9FIRM|nr:hypothetical protein [Limnochorda sp. LNt]WRP13553.1 hypothetical protein VLY81_08815 [Limnochorda sp. LNt]